ncbi:MAG: FAD-binding oxidoreductase [Pseudomonadota bacterium]
MSLTPSQDSPPVTPVLDRIRTLLGPSGVIEAPDAAAYLDEPRDRYPGQTVLVARPGSTEEVASLLKLCAAARLPVVPRSGGTGLVGGQTKGDEPRPLVLSLDRMTAIRDVNAQDNAMTVEAGAILASVQEAAQAVDRLFPLSLASEGSCRVGGLLATNAGGIQVLRYGNARDLCLGIEAVMADGTIVRDLKSLRKDNTGYDLRHLLIGSEGTLGIITAASLKLFPRPAETATAFCAVPSPEAAIALLRQCQSQLGESISAFELIPALSIRMTLEHIEGARCPLATVPEWAVLIEAGAQGAGETLEAALKQAFETELITDAAIAASLSQAAGFWHLRETIPQANRRVGSIASHDISVPISGIPRFLSETESALRAIAPDVRITAFGHLGDGNLHYNLFPAKGRNRQDYANLAPDLTRIVHDRTHVAQGSISAEHGVGRIKAADLQRYGDPGKLRVMRALKATLDPHNILNPGAVFPTPTPDATDNGQEPR